MSTATNSAALLEALEATPLLGEGLVRAEALRAALTQRLSRQPDPPLQLRAQLCFGALLLQRGAPNAASFLLELARQAEARELPLLATRARLLAVRARCRSGDLEGARALLDRCEPALAAHPTLHLDGLLARAWPGPIDAVALLEEALERLPASRDHDRLEASLELADRCERGGDPYRARHALEAALDLARRHDARGPAGRASLLLASLQLRCGDQQGARAQLEETLGLAGERDDLVRGTAGLLLSALLLGEQAWEPLLETTAPLLEGARRRHNPALLASLVLDRAAALWALGRSVDALVALMACSVELAPHPLPLELIRARFAELFDELGAEGFQGLVQQAAATMRAPV
jgi:hypothetical protein